MQTVTVSDLQNDILSAVQAVRDEQPFREVKQ